MEIKRKFWLQVALDLEETEKNGSPKKWEKKFIEVFIGKLGEKLERIRKQDHKRAELIGKASFRVMGYTTFWRIFREGGNGSKSYRNHFAIYLGYGSYNDYIEKNQLVSKYFSKEPKTKLAPIPEYVGIGVHKAPYLGLQTFSMDECRLFYGRDKDQERLIHYLNESLLNEDRKIRFHDLILLYGQSGVGKSSLLHAGIFPRLLPDWNIYYKRRQHEVGLSAMFEEAISERPKLLILEQVGSLFDLDVRNPQAEINAFVDCFEQFSRQQPNTRFKIVLACKTKYIDQVETGIKKSELSETFITIKMQDASTEETYLKRIFYALETQRGKLLLVSSLGERHNLYRAFLKKSFGSWELQYTTRQKEYTLGYLFRLKMKERKRLIIFDQVEEAITKPNNIYSRGRELSADNKELVAFVEGISNYLGKHENCKIILSFRENHLSPINHIVEEYMPNQFEHFLIKALNEDEVREAIEGPLEDGSFKLKYYDGFVDDIISLLKDDKSSNICPALQIIMKKLWEQTKGTNRLIDKPLFKQCVSRQGTILEQFLKEQLEKIKQLRCYDA